MSNTARLDLDAIRARVEATTDGPTPDDEANAARAQAEWLADSAVAPSDSETWIEAFIVGAQWAADQANRAVVTHARTDVPALLAEVERLRAVVREAGACSHPVDSITWDFKMGDGTIAIIDGAVHGACDLCGNSMKAAVPEARR